MHPAVNTEQRHDRRQLVGNDFNVRKQRMSGKSKTRTTRMHWFCLPTLGNYFCSTSNHILSFILLQLDESWTVSERESEMMSLCTKSRRNMKVHRREGESITCRFRPHTDRFSHTSVPQAHHTNTADLLAMLASMAHLFRLKGNPSTEG